MKKTVFHAQSYGKTSGKLLECCNLSDTEVIEYINECLNDGFKVIKNKASLTSKTIILTNPTVKIFINHV